MRRPGSKRTATYRASFALSNRLLDNKQFQDYLKQARALAETRDTPYPARDSSQAETKSAQTQVDFNTLACPSCGGKLEITTDIERFACAHCGREHTVRRSGGTVSLAPVVNSLKKVETGVDKTAAELALARLQREIDDLENRERVLIALSPAELSPLSCVLLVLGVLLSLASLVALRDASGPACLTVGMIMAAVGFAWVFSHSSATRKWQKNRQAQLLQTYAALAEKKAEQSRYLRIVSK